MVSWASNSTALFWKSRRLVSTSDRKFNHSRGTTGTYFWETSSTWNRMWVDFWDRYMIMKIGENLVHDCKQYSAPQAKILGFKSIISVWKRCKTAENFAYNFHISESKDTKESRSDSLVHPIYVSNPFHPLGVCSATMLRSTHWPGESLASPSWRVLRQHRGRQDVHIPMNSVLFWALECTDRKFVSYISGGFLANLQKWQIGGGFGVLTALLVHPNIIVTWNTRTLHQRTPPNSIWSRRYSVSKSTTRDFSWKSSISIQWNFIGIWGRIRR